MKNIVVAIFLAITLIGCTLPPRPIIVGSDREKTINSKLLCAEEIVVYQISINGALPNKGAFDYSMEKLKEYTSSNLVFPKIINLNSTKNIQTDYLINRIATNNIKFLYLTDEEKNELEKIKQPTNPKHDMMIIVYSPKSDGKMRGYFTVYNETNFLVFYSGVINNTYTLFNQPAWKIVLMHIIGHTLGVPSHPSHTNNWKCTHPECVMYKGPDIYAVTSVVLLNGMPYDFCEECKAELTAHTKNHCSK